MQAASVTDDINNITGNNSTKAKRDLSQNYQEFLLLLTTQLKNQDPTDPTDTNALTQQIATLSQVEQQISTNKNLETLISMFASTQYNSVVSYIGKKIDAAGDVGALQDGEGLFAYYLEREAGTVNITIKDEAGNVVYQGEGNKKAGRNEFVWDGKNNNGEDMPAGTYKFEISAKDASNNDITSKTYVTGVVTSVDSAGGVVYLTFGDISVPLTSVVSVGLAEPKV